MTNYYFSPSTLGFYPDDACTYFPEDKVQISKELYLSLLEQNAQGKIISADSGGNPIAIDPPPPTAEQYRQRRDLLIAQTDWTQGVDVPQTIKEKWAIYRQALRDIPQQSTFPTTVTWPTLPN